MNVFQPIKPSRKARVGLFSVGHFQYWNQFEGLLERLVNYGASIEQQLSEWCSVCNAGMIDTDEKAHRAGEWFNQNNVDILFCYVPTYATSASHLAVAKICKRPVVVLNLQPAARINYTDTTTAEGMVHCGACCVPEIANAYTRSGLAFHVVSGLLGLDRAPEIALADERTKDHPEAIAAWQEIQEWVRAASVVRTLQEARLGFLGHTYPGMLDMYSDFTMVHAQTGMYVELLEMCDLARLLETVTDDEKQKKLNEVKQMFIISEDSPSDPLARKPSPEQLERACAVAVAEEKLVREFDLDALAYYYRGSNGNSYQQLQAAFIVGYSLLTARGIPCSGEGDTKTAIAMKICDILGVGGSYTEIVTADYVNQTMLLGHDGPFHLAISSDKPILRGMGLYHGKWGSGVSVEAKVRSGPITLLGITQTVDGRLKMIVNQGEATNDEILHVGNTMTHVRFAKPPRQFMDEWFSLGPTHHCAMSVGHNASVFRKVADLLGWPFETVCL